MMNCAPLLSRRLVLTTAVAGSALPVRCLASPPATGWRRCAEIVAAIHPPQIPSRDTGVTDFGAVGDGQTDCTAAFQRAIDASHNAGGGRVTVPPGHWLCGALILKSNIDLHLAKGATISFSTDPAKYLPPVLTRWEGVELMNYAPLIYAFGQTNVAITGEGVLDGNADNTHWWPWCSAPKFGWTEGRPNQIADRAKLFAMGEANIPVVQRGFGAASTLRPPFIQFYRCRNVLIEGVTIRRAPFWQIHPVLCANVIVRGVTMSSYGPNNDGCDPESCDHVLIENCTFDTGDDCIAIKSGRNADGRRIGVPSQNIVIRNCLLKNGHGGITIGSEISGGVKHVYVENCRMEAADLGSAIRIKSNAVRGGTLEHIHVRDVAIARVSHAVLTIDLNYEEGANGPFRPVVRDVTLERVTSGASPNGIDLQGLPGAEVSDIVLKDCDLKNVTAGNIVRNVRRLTMDNVIINGARVTP
ncbi:glycoside hydrolase family 28 protein [Rhizomicrobium electricum]|nr:glycoside hydrolase family 28 protein [Rhizomicrobium electricum]NIJ48043.1 polygalacturonase [Rhizomicrobium electricum]